MYYTDSACDVGQGLALFKSPSGGGLTKWGQQLSEVHWSLLFCSLKLLGPGDLRKQVCSGPKTLHYAKFWAQNATKTSAGNIPESLSNLFLRDICRLLQRLLNNAKSRQKFLELNVGIGDWPFQGSFVPSICRNSEWSGSPLHALKS